MSAAVSITESNVFKAIGDFLTSIVLASTAVVRGQNNRVPEPAGSDFVVMWPLLRSRLSQNVSVYNDVAFTGSINLLVLTVTAMQANSGAIATGQVLTGVGVAINTVIGAQLSGTAGGVGTYAISISQMTASTLMQSGGRAALMPTQLDVQLDVHGPQSADNAQIIKTLFRDQYGLDNFAASGFDLRPLYASEPKQMPFMNAEQQYENRWTIDLSLQINSTVTLPQQFSTALTATVISAEREYQL